MGVFLGILAVIGKILLIILIVAAILVALALFFPIMYRIKFLKKEEFKASGTVRWVFVFVIFSFNYENKIFTWKLWIFGIPVHLILNRNKNKNLKVPVSGDGSPPPGTEFKPAKKQPTIKPGERTIEVEVEDESEEKLEPETWIDEKGRRVIRSRGFEDGKLQRLRKDKHFAEGRKPTLFEKIKLTFTNICDKLKKAGNIIGALEDILTPVIAVVKHAFPKRGNGYIEYGFEDPSSTGKLTGFIASLCLPIPKGLEIYPNFEKEIFEVDAEIAGRAIFIIVLINLVKLFKVPALKAVLDKNKKPKKEIKKRKVRTKKYKVKINQGGGNG